MLTESCVVLSLAVFPFAIACAALAMHQSKSKMLKKCELLSTKPITFFCHATPLFWSGAAYMDGSSLQRENGVSASHSSDQFATLGTLMQIQYQFHFPQECAQYQQLLQHYAYMHTASNDETFETIAIHSDTSALIPPTLPSYELPPSSPPHETIIASAAPTRNDDTMDTVSRRFTCNRKKWTKVILLRIAIRVLALLSLFLIIKLFDYKTLVNHVLNWVDHFPLAAAMAIFFAIASIFVSVMPGSYASTVAAGAMFGIPIGATLGWLVMNTGALLNMFYIRKPLRRVVHKFEGCVNKVARFEGLDLLIDKRPVHTTVLMRLPYLYSGILNYVFALSGIQWKHYALGNAIGFIPGSILFAALGQQARTLWQLFTEKSWNVSAIVILVTVIVLVVGAIVGIVLLTRRIIKKEVEKEKAEKQGLTAQSNDTLHDAEHDLEAPAYVPVEPHLTIDEGGSAQPSKIGKQKVEDGMEMAELQPPTE